MVRRKFRDDILLAALFLVIGFCASMPYAVGQNAVKLPNIVPPAPDAQAIGKFGEIPVGLFTGTPDISIPVYDLTVGSFTLPIRLSYHSSGVKVEEVSSSVGQNWALVAGGTISAGVNGFPDLEGNGFARSSYRLPDQAFQSPITFDGSYSNGGAEYDYASRVASGEVDAEPDLFFYNFCGFSGKFYFDQDAQCHTVPFTPLKFEWVANYLFPFTITDPQGNKYIFQNSESSTIGEACGSSNNGSYHLSQIILKNNDVITFQYEAVNYIYKTHANQARSVPIPGQTSVGGKLVDLDCFGTAEAANINVQGVRLKQITSTRGHLILFNYGLNRSDLSGTQALTSIDIKYQNESIKTFTLQHSYFISEPELSLSPERRRLRLDSVSEGDKVHRFYYNEQVPLPNRLSNAQDHWGYFNGRLVNTTLLPIDYEKGFIDGANREVDTAFIRAGILEKIVFPTGGYSQFEYEPNDYYYSGPEKSFTSKNQFLSGTPNGITTKTFSIPSNVEALNVVAVLVANPLGGPGEMNNSSEGNLCTIELSGDNGYQTSWSNVNSSQAGFGLLLLPGTYTMRVTTNGDFSNTYLQIKYQEMYTEQVNKNLFLGGLRIKKIKSYSHPSDAIPIIKVYRYGKPDSAAVSSGRINYMPRYVAGITYTLSHFLTDENQVVTSVSFSDHSYWRQTATPVFSLGSIHGGSVGYSFVEVWEGEDAENGKVTSTFSFSGDSGGADWYPLVTSISNDWKSGLLIEEALYRKEGTDFRLLQKKTNHYSERPEAEFWNAHFQPSTYKADDYLRGWGVKISFKHPEYVFGLNKVPAEFNWRDYHFISRWVRLDSTVVQYVDEQDVNRSIYSTTKFTYNNTYSLQPGVTTTYNSKNEIVEEVRKYAHDPISNLSAGAQQAKTELVNRWNVSEVLEQQLKKNGSLLSTTRYNYKVTTDNIIVADNIEQSSKLDPLETRVSFTVHDSKGNVRELHKANDVLTAYLWGYNHQYPVAEGVNAASNEIYYNSFEEGNEGVGDAAAKTGKRSYSGNYTLNFTLPAGTAKQFVVTYWAHNGNKWELKEESYAGPGKVLVGSKIDEVRVFPQNAQMTTYTYKPLVGMTSQTDPNGNTTYYEYDGFGRLLHIRDKDNNLLKKFCYNYQGQAEECTAYGNTAKSGVFTRNNCGSGFVGGQATYTVPAGTYYAASQAAADQLAQGDIDQNGQGYANQNGTCTPIYYSVQKSGSYTKNNCPGGGTGSAVTYTVAAGAYSSTVSQADADSKAQNDVNLNGQAYANQNGTCTWYSVQKSATFTKNNCISGGVGSNVTYTVAAGAYTSTVSQADADAKAQSDVNTNGQVYANQNGTCTWYSAQKSGAFAKNNCAPGGTGSTVTYTVPAGRYSSTISQADADGKAQNDVNLNGQNYANANGYCTWYNTQKSGTFTKNNCAAGGTGSQVTYSVPAGAYSSTVSQADADSKAQNDVNLNGQAYANQNGTCTWYSVQKSATFTKNDCATGGTGSSVTYMVPGGSYSSTISQADADSKAQSDVNTNGQAYANTNGYCTWYSVQKSGTFTRNNCPSGSTGSQVTYTVYAGTHSSTISQADADGKAQNDVNTNGQNFANTYGTCTAVCSSSNCSAEGYKCVGGVCERGIKVYTFSMSVGNQWYCEYHYEWSNGSWSQDYQEYSSNDCLPGGI